MSLLNTTMYNNQLNSFSPGHMRSRSYNELLTQFKASITSKSDTKPLFTTKFRSKKRSLSDLLTDDSNAIVEEEFNKRSRTAPPSPPSPCAKFSKNVTLDLSGETKKRARSLSPDKAAAIDHKLVSPVNSASVSPSVSPILANELAPESKLTARSLPPTLPKPKENITLPGIGCVLNGGLKSYPNLKKPITPTTSLEYFDTYKPNDENWRFGLLDSMDKNSKKFYTANQTALPAKPVFDSRINPSLLNPSMLHLKTHNIPMAPKFEQERKINFPYEANYTYLNKTYMRDVERYPDYLELAHSLVNMSSHQSYHGYPSYETPQAQRQYFGAYPPHNGDAAHSVQFPPLYPVNSPSAQVAASAFITPPANRYPVFTPQTSCLHKSVDETSTPKMPPKRSNSTKFIPITPPSSNAKVPNDGMRSPIRSSQPPRVCISCGSDQSPCWRPSWSSKEGQLCNSCGLRYKKTAARCLNDECRKIPAKGEWSLMLNKGTRRFEDGTECYGCLQCGWKVEVKR